PVPVTKTEMSTPLDNVQFWLCRNQDVLRTKVAAGPCCKNLAYYRNEKLWCVDCKRPRGRLPPKVIAALISAINAMPTLKTQTWVFRDEPDIQTADPVEGNQPDGELPSGQ